MTEYSNRTALDNLKDIISLLERSECIKKGLTHHVAERTVLYRGTHTQKNIQRNSLEVRILFARRSV